MSICSKTVASCALLSLAACTHTYALRSSPVPDYGAKAPIPLDVELAIPPELRAAKWEHTVSGDTWRMDLKDHLATGCVDLARRAFRSVALASHQEARPQSSARALVAPRLVTLIGTAPQTVTLTIKIEWTITDSEGNLRWIETVTGSNHRAGSGDAVIAAATTELFQRSFAALHSSPEIRALAE